MSPFRLLIPITALAVACASSSGPSFNFAGASAVSPARGERVAIDHAVVLLDASSSIAGFPDSQAASTSFVDAMPNGSYDAGSIVFGGSQRSGQPMGSFSRSPLKSSVANASHFGGYTPIPAVLDEARMMGRAKAGDLAVVLFSDGVPTEGSRVQPSWDAMEAGKRLVRSQPDNRVCIHTVQTGSSPVGASLLKSLSALSDCGTSRSAASLQSASAMSDFAKTVFFLGDAQPPLPAPRPTAPGDRDGDGIIDSRDACPNTPRGASVNSRGCWVLKDITFATDSDVIQSRYEPELRNAISVLKQNPGLRIRVEGHTDSRGPEVYNQALSERRAQSVRDYIVKAGISASRVEAKGFGEANPIASNSTREGMAENRRIQFKILN